MGVDLIHGALSYMIFSPPHSIPRRLRPPAYGSPSKIKARKNRKNTKDKKRKEKKTSAPPAAPYCHGALRERVKISMLWS
jgi:hypothetical protein